MTKKEYQTLNNIIFCSINFIISYVISHHIMLKHIVHAYPQLFYVLLYLMNLFIISKVFKNNCMFFKLCLSSFFSGGLALIISALCYNQLCSGAMCQPAQVVQTTMISFVAVFYFSKQYISIVATMIIYFAVKKLSRYKYVSCEEK